MDVNEHGIKQPPRMSIEDYEAKMDERGLTLDGKELPDPTPMAPPVGFVKQPSMIENIRNMIRSEALRQAALETGHESFEDADDFDVPDDPEPISRHEVADDLEPVASLRQKQKDAESAAAAAPAEPPNEVRPAPKDDKPPAKPASD